MIFSENLYDPRSGRGHAFRDHAPVVEAAKLQDIEPGETVDLAALVRERRP